jgi:hypothetical protein
MTNILGGLVKKRAELVGEINYFDQQIQQKMTNLKAIDGAIHVFDPAYKLEKIKPRHYRPVPLNRSEFMRRILDILRESNGTATPWQIAAALLAERNQDPEDGHLLTAMYRRVTKALQRRKSQDRAKTL